MTARPQDVALLPCPFCGGEPKVRIPQITDGYAVHVRCRCGVEMYGGRAHFATGDDAIAAWNTRANVTAALASAQAREEELRAEVAENEGAIRVWRRRCTKAEARAERLEEALRDGLSGLNGLFASGDYPLTDEVAELGLAIIEDMQAALSTNAATQTGETR